MLDREKVIKELNRVGNDVYKKRQSMPWFNAELWQKIMLSPLTICKQTVDQYAVFAVDGSQIYPDNHMEGIDCFLVNAGGCFLSYQPLVSQDPLDSLCSCHPGACAGPCPSKSPGSIPPSSTAKLFSEPTIYTPSTQQWPGERFSIDLVDLVREEHEFTFMLKHLPEFLPLHSALRASIGANGESPARQSRAESREASEVGISVHPDGAALAANGGIATIGLFDGNLLFWYLESKPAEVKEYFLKRYISCLQKLYEQRLVTIGYLSASRFTDIVKLVSEAIGGVKGGLSAVATSGQRLEMPLITYSQHETLQALLPIMTDADLLAHVLVPGQRTSIFVSTDDITQAYPDPLKPCFLYLHVGSEIVRIELPAWVAQQPDLVYEICAICLDQCTKGQGYPVALAEAHAQAVVQGGDRDFFYQMLYKRSLSIQASMKFSPKSFKKRVLGF